MTNDPLESTGIYIAYLTSPASKSIYRAKKYKTEVNNQNLKVGIAKKSFKSRKSGYEANFDYEVEFLPFIRIKREFLEDAEIKIITAILSNNILRVGRSREWFYTTDINGIKKIIIEALSKTDIEHEYIEQHSI